MDEPPAAPRPPTDLESGACPSVSAVDRPRAEEEAPTIDEATPVDVRSVYRHTLPTRIGHWITVLCLPILALSGFQIFNAHPALYWGDRSDRDHPLFSLTAISTPTGEIRGITQLFGVEFDTTGVLGASEGGDTGLRERGFPHWATLPGSQWLAMGRRWHFFFAWVFVLTGTGFGLYAFVSRHFTRDLLPLPRDLGTLGRSIRDHLRFRHPSAAATRYNVLQKIAYTGVVFGLGPLIVLTGLAMSPRFDAAIPVIVHVLGGRQSARTLHFLVTFAFIGFTVTHLFMVAVTGIVNNLRSIVTGWHRLPDNGGMNGHVDSD
jgi:thiosulfate reductase cytochrome b subunit